MLRMLSLALLGGREEARQGNGVGGAGLAQWVGGKLEKESCQPPSRAAEVKLLWCVHTPCKLLGVSI